jgi:hypothetical protein
LTEKNHISEDYRKRVDELLRNQSDPYFINSLNKEELDEIWREISSEMDISDVWDDISSDLDIQMPAVSGSGIIVKYVAIVLLIVASLIPVRKGTESSVPVHTDNLTELVQDQKSEVLIIKDKQVDSKTEKRVKGTIVPESERSPVKREDMEKPALADISEIRMVEETLTLENADVNPDITQDAVINNIKPADSPDLIHVEESNLPTLFLSVDPERTKEISRTDFSNLEINSDVNMTSFTPTQYGWGRISVGLMASLKNTWLLNYETLDGLRTESLTTTKIVFYPDAGLSLGYSLNTAWQLQADAFLYSNTGQSYFIYNYGHYSKKNITLCYSTIVLSAKYKLTLRGDPGNRSSINLITGGYLSVLNSSIQRINTDLENIKSQYDEFDLGLRLGSEFELYVSDHFSLAPGIFLSVSIPDIYKGSSNIRSTHNGSAVFSFSFYYHFD